MIPLVSAEEMRAIDRVAIEDLKVPSLTLMEAAGRGVAEAMCAHFGIAEGRRVLIVCGKGNNGGDGFVTARALRERGIQPVVAVVGEAGELSPDAREMASRWEAGVGQVRYLSSEADLDAFFASPPDVDFVVDALLGTGSKGSPRGAIGRAIRGIMDLGRPVVAVDIPSGMDADTGEVPGDVVSAELTVTLGLPKRGHYLYPAREHVGALEVVDIGIPRQAIVAQAVARFVLEAADVASFLPRWPGNAHKGLRGRLLLVGGSVGLTGAITMAAQAAARAGAGLVTAGVPASLNDVLEMKLTEAMTLPLPEAPGRCLARAALDSIRGFDQGRLTAMVVGPGIGRHDDTQALVREVISGFGCPKVLDADGLFAFRGRAAELASDAIPGPLVLTPHPGEAEWLMGRSAGEIDAGRLDLAAEWAEKHGQVLVLKGAPTVIGSPEGEAFVNSTGGPALASGGTGDVLAGLIGGFLAQGLSPLHAALAGVYLHGLAADLIVDERGPYGLVASDLIEEIPGAMAEVAGESL